MSNRKEIFSMFRNYIDESVNETMKTIIVDTEKKVKLNFELDAHPFVILGEKTKIPPKLLAAYVASTYITYKSYSRGRVFFDGDDNYLKEARIREFLGSAPFYSQFIKFRSSTYLRDLLKHKYPDIKINKEL